VELVQCRAIAGCLLQSLQTAMLKSTAVDRNLTSLFSGIMTTAALLLSAPGPVAAGPAADPAPALSLHLTDSEAMAVGRKVWRNECGGRIDGLTSWNVGEDFPSLGIGHFIWYPPNAHDKFEESFPRLLAFLQAQGTKLPSWLKVDMHCPWTSREQFLSELKGKELTELRAMLAATVPGQTRFIVQRLEQALPKMLDILPPQQREKIRSRFYRVATSGSAGAFALIDYVNFKGEGVNLGERYNGQGWGLLQVLQGMSDEQNALAAFSQSAAATLTLRVENSPPERHEARWLLGWKKRVANYCSISGKDGKMKSTAWMKTCGRP
jgi:hypothetical protein